MLEPINILAQSLQFWIRFDILLFCVLSVLIAIPLYRNLYDAEGRLRLQRKFFVDVSVFSPFDFIGVTLIVILFAGSSLYSVSEAHLKAIANAAEPPKITVGALFTQIMLMTTISGGILIIIGMRQNLVKVLGLNPFKIDGNGKIKKPKEWSLLVFLLPIAALILIYTLGYIYTKLKVGEWVVSVLGPHQKQALVQQMLENPSQELMLTMVFIAVIIAPLTEEIIFRGYIYGTLKKHIDPFISILVTSIIFALIHDSLWGIILLIIVGIVLNIAYEATGSLWTPIILHMLFNGMNTFKIVFKDKIPELQDKLEQACIHLTTYLPQLL